MSQSRADESRAARVHDGAVDSDIPGGDDVAPIARGQQRHREAGRSQRVDERAEEDRGHLVTEGVRKRVGEKDTHRTRRPSGQRPRRWVGPDVAEILGRGQDPKTEGLRELVGAREGVGHGHPTHADPLGDRLECHSASIAHLSMTLVAAARAFAGQARSRFSRPVGPDGRVGKGAVGAPGEAGPSQHVGKSKGGLHGGSLKDLYRYSTRLLYRSSHQDQKARVTGATPASRWAAIGSPCRCAPAHRPRASRGPRHRRSPCLAARP